MKNLFIILISLFFATSCTSTKSEKQEEKNVFILKKETGFDWGTPLTTIFSEMSTNKETKVTKKDNQQINGWQEAAAIAADAISVFSGDEEVGEAYDNLENNVYREGPIVICNPVIFLGIAFEHAYYRCYTCKGEEPMFNQGTLDMIEYYKKYKEEEKDIADNDYKKIKDYFSKVGTKAESTNGSNCYITDTEEISIYYKIEKDGLIFIDENPVLEIVIRPFNPNNIK